MSSFWNVKMLHRVWNCTSLQEALSRQFSRSFSSFDRPAALRNRKNKSQRRDTLKRFVDSNRIQTVGGKGGDGCISFLQLWSNSNAGPDGGDGGNGGHILLQASADVNDLQHIDSVLRAADGEKGSNVHCHGRNASHTVIKVPIGTVVRNQSRTIVGDLAEPEAIFVAARGGAGGKGNHFFTTDVNQAPQVAEYGADGENNSYYLELATIAHVGLIGFPNAGKSTLLQAISRARPKVAPYPFTTLHPHLGIVTYEDYEQIAVADLPGLIPESHCNKGLGIDFLKHAERCPLLLFLLDASADESWETLNILRDEIRHFNPGMLSRPHLIVANKIDLPSAQENLPLLTTKIEEQVIPISAKVGTNLHHLLGVIREMYDESRRKLKEIENSNT